MTLQKIQTKKGTMLNIPMACSAIALILAFTGILLALEGRYTTSFGVMLIAVWFDMVDGAISRKLKQESAFGAVFDLLQDVVNYIVYPVILFYLLLFHGLTSVILLLVFAVAGTTRLARFHTIGFTENNGKLTYLGMPVYFNHFLCLGVLLLQPYHVHTLFLIIALPLASLLMVTTIPFPKPRSLLLWSIVLIGTAALFYLK